jgi:hypothetical protein
MIEEPAEDPKTDSPYKLLSNYESGSTHLQSLHNVKKANESCNYELENYYEREIIKLKTDLENLKQTEDELLEDEQKVS